MLLRMCLLLMVLGLSMKSATAYGQAPAVTASLAPVQSQPSYTPRAPRMALESLLGVVGGAGLWLATTYLGCEALGCEELQGLGMMIMTSPMIPIGMALGIYGAGVALDGNGGLGWTILGTLGGSLVSVLGVAILVNSNGGDEISGLLTITLPPLIGGIMGFERSHDEPTINMAPHMTVSIDPTTKGAILALTAAL